MFSILQILALNQQKHASKETNSFSTISLHSFCFYKKVVFQIEVQTSYFFRILRLKTFLPASYFIGIWGLTFLFFFKPEVQCWHFSLSIMNSHIRMETQFCQKLASQAKTQMQAVFFSTRISISRNWGSSFFFFLNSGSATFLRTSWFYQILRLAFL